MLDLQAADCSSGLRVRKQSAMHMQRACLESCCAANAKLERENEKNFRDHRSDVAGWLLQHGYK
jgi:hypothetical protein